MFTYYLMDGLTRVDYSDGNYVSYSYDNACRLTKVTTPFGSTSYEYDLNGNLVRVIGSAQSALYEYNVENKLVKATVQNLSSQNKCGIIKEQ